MAEKTSHFWQVPLFWLRDRGRIGEIGVKCNGCGHERSWPVGDMMQEHGPRTLVSDLAHAGLGSMEALAARSAGRGCAIFDCSAQGAAVVKRSAQKQTGINPSGLFGLSRLRQ